jgi:threonine synthase
LQKYLESHPEQKGYILETAHPVKFYDVVEPVINQQVPIPDNVKSILNKQKVSLLMNPDFGELKEYLLAKEN